MTKFAAVVGLTPWMEASETTFCLAIAGRTDCQEGWAMTPSKAALVGMSC